MSLPIPKKVRLRDPRRPPHPKDRLISGDDCVEAPRESSQPACAVTLEKFTRNHARIVEEVRLHQVNQCKSGIIVIMVLKNISKLL